MSKRHHKLLVQDMVDAAHKVFKYTEGMSFEGFLEDEKTKDAVIRNFEILGEASIRMNEDYKSLNPQIDWKTIRGFRNRIVHDYMGVDYEIVWEIIQTDLEELLFQLKKLQ